MEDVMENIMSVILGIFGLIMIIRALFYLKDFKNFLLGWHKRNKMKKENKLEEEYDEVLSMINNSVLPKKRDIDLLKEIDGLGGEYEEEIPDHPFVKT
jgi:hypothetical protein